MGGDIKYLDINGDGVITTADIAPIGFPTTPEVSYGLGFSSGFYNFDFSVFINGIARRSFWIDVPGTAPVYNNNQILKDYANSYWSDENRNLYAIWPRLSENLNDNNSRTSTWFMRDGTFMRLRQVELGYTIPRRLQEKLHSTNFRIYVTALNPLTFSKFKMWDPEMGGNGLG